MLFKDSPIQRKVMLVVFLASGAVALLTCTAFAAYEFLTFRQNAARQLSTLGKIVATNSTAALAFDNRSDAMAVLGALRAEPHIVAAAIYDRRGTPFVTFPATLRRNVLPATPETLGVRFEHGHLVSVHPIVQDGHLLGTLFLESDMAAMYQRFRLYGAIALVVMAASILLGLLLSRPLQRRVSRPILALAETARAIALRRDYSVRAARGGNDELGLLTDAFNQMLTQIHEYTEEQLVAERRLQAQLSRLDLLNRITRATGERQDLSSIFDVIVRSLEDNLPIDFGCICLYDAATRRLTVMTVGAKSRATADRMGMHVHDTLPIDQNALAHCVTGVLVYEPDLRTVPFPFPERMAREGLRSLVAAPLLVEERVFGMLVAARNAVDAFNSADCEFLRQLSEHAALAAHQATLHAELQHAYDELRQTQRAVMQQERLKALGEMASGIAHDINNAISPAALYTESLLEKETTLSDRARDYLGTIQRAIGDVANTVARMREFYRGREPQLQLAPIDMNRIVRQVIDLTRARWRDLPQERGVMIGMTTDLAPELPTILGAQGEIRDALTNLIFNAVDAMSDGGTITIRTRAVSLRGHPGGETPPTFVEVAVIDTGVGMDEETRRRSLEPFFTTKGERGTGLGLAMVYGMAQRHSAEIDIDSTPGHGTEVRLRFPVPVAAVDAVPAPLPPPAVRPLHVLVVDDDPILLGAVRDILHADGHRVATADGGERGIAAFIAAREHGEPFDVVITDLGMPYADGRTVADSVKRQAPGTPVILLTGWGQRLLADRTIPPTVDRLLSKPPKLNELRAALAELTGTATQRATGED